MATDKEIWILYQTTNLVNGKIYVGVHKLANTWHSKAYLGSGRALKSAIEKYGRDNFTRITLAKFSCAEDVYFAEAEMVTEEFINRPDTYNMCLGGNGGTNLTEEVRAKLLASRIGSKASPETRAKMSASHKGNKHNLGKKLSEEAKIKISMAHKGKPRSAETKAKISAGHKGKVVSEETRIKLRTVNTGAKNYRSCPVIINGKYYESINTAAKSEMIPYPTMWKRMVSTTYKFENYRFATENEKLEYTSKNKVLAEEILDLTK